MDAHVGKFRITCIEGDQYIGPVLRAGYEWDAWMRRDLETFYRPGTDILDVGGNIGWNALMFSDYGPVHTFEPLFHEYIQKNVAQNTLDHPVTIHPYGLSSKACQVPIYLPRADGTLRNYGGTSVHLSDSHDESSSTLITLKRLDDVYDGPHGPSMMKIDVEGHELDVLQGARNTIQRWKPTLWVEVFNFSTKHPVVEFLTKELGYTTIQARPESNYLFKNCARTE